MQTIEQIKKNFASFLCAYAETASDAAAVAVDDEKVEGNYKEAEWYSELAPQEKQRIDELEANKDSLQKRIEAIKAGRDYHVTKEKIISKSLVGLGTPKSDEDVEEQRTFYEKVDLYRFEIAQLNRELRILEEQKVLDTPIDGGTITEGERRSELFDKSSKKLSADDKFTDILGEKSLSGLTAGEIYLLKKEGFDLSSLFLYPVCGHTEVKKEIIGAGDGKTNELLVNFGGNSEANKVIGAGDLLPFERVSRVEINGVGGVRKYPPMDGVTRPGYYSESGKYLAIYDGYKIKVIEEKALEDDELAKLEEAFDSRFSSYRRSEIINYIYAQGLGTDETEIKLPFSSKHDINILNHHLSSVFPEDKQQRISYDSKTGTLKATGGETIKSMLSSISEYTGKGTRHLAYMSTLQGLEKKYGIPSGVMTRLIYHENRSWEPTARNRSSGAYGLGQMIDSTWARFGTGLNRNNPHDQLESTARYLKHIKEYRGCTDEMAIALYNTGEYFKYNSDDRAPGSYVSGNTPIVNKIPRGLQSDQVSKKEYFIGAVAYYNDLDYSAAKSLSGL